MPEVVAAAAAVLIGCGILNLLSPKRELSILNSSSATYEFQFCLAKIYRVWVVASIIRGGMKGGKSQK